MSKMATLSTRVDYDIHDFIKNFCIEEDISVSEWLQNAITCYSCWLADTEYDEDDNPGYTWDDISEMDENELIELVKIENLDIDPDDYPDDDDLANAIADALGIIEASEEKD